MCYGPCVFFRLPVDELPTSFMRIAICFYLCEASAASAPRPVKFHVYVINEMYTCARVNTSMRTHLLSIHYSDRNWWEGHCNIDTYTIRTGRRASIGRSHHARPLRACSDNAPISCRAAFELIDASSRACFTCTRHSWARASPIRAAIKRTHARTHAR